MKTYKCKVCKEVIVQVKDNRPYNEILWIYDVIGNHKCRGEKIDIDVQR